jgi:hypothetical protein
LGLVSICAITLAAGLCLTSGAAMAHPPSYCAACPRDSAGRIRRSRAVKRAFRKTHPCPATGQTTGPCPGYVIDHIRPLKRGGADAPWNMQWESLVEARRKDKVE